MFPHGPDQAYISFIYRVYFVQPPKRNISQQRIKIFIKYIKSILEPLGAEL